MSRQVFINLPVKDLARSKAFFDTLGFTFTEQFSNEHAACLNLTDNTFAMLLTEEFFGGFTDKTIADATVVTECVLALAVESREEAEMIAEKAAAIGGKETREPQDHGFMYSRAFQDLDGHVWEVVWMEDVDEDELNMPEDDEETAE